MFDNFFPKLVEVFSKHYISIFKGLGRTLAITFGAIIIGLLIGTIIAAINTIPKKKSNYFLRFVKFIGDCYLWLFRGTPIVVQLLIFYFIILATTNASAMLVAIIVFGLNSGAYVSEIMRGGILSVDKGQLEASRSLGMNYSQSMSVAVLPQALKNAIPNIGNEFITLFKETSVAGFITVMDITMTMRNITSATYNVVVPYILLAVFYLLLVTLFTWLLRLIERRLRKGDIR